MVALALVFLSASCLPLISFLLDRRQARSVRVDQALLHFLTDVFVFIFISIVQALCSSRVTRVLLCHLLLRPDSLAGL